MEEKNIWRKKGVDIKLDVQGERRRNKKYAKKERLGVRENNTI